MEEDLDSSDTQKLFSTFELGTGENDHFLQCKKRNVAVSTSERWDPPTT